jgi:CheY-like chemotaxis protein
MTLKLFVADDSVTIQKIVSLAFSGEDVLIETAADGNSALDKIPRFMPDAVLADVFMPGCSGYEVCSRIKENPGLKHIPVILLVGTFEPFDASEAVRVQFDGHLTKPFDTSELIQTIHSLIDGKATAPRDAGSVDESTASRNEQDSTKHRSSDQSSAREPVSRAALESFLGETRVLDILDPNISPAPIEVAVQAPAKTTELATPRRDLSEESLNLIVEKVVSRMSPDIIREVAWEVVPELCEVLLRDTLKDQL